MSRDAQRSHDRDDQTERPEERPISHVGVDGARDQSASGQLRHRLQAAWPATQS